MEDLLSFVTQSDAKNDDLCNFIAQSDAKNDDLLNFVAPLDIKNGIIITHFPNSSQIESEVSYKNNVRHGSYKYYWYNDDDYMGCDKIILSKGTFNNGYYDGIIETYDIDGSISTEVMYKNNMRNGPYTYYHKCKNGEHVVSEKGTFHNGYRIGRVQKYDECGRIWWEYFKDGAGNYHGDYIAYTYEPNMRCRSKAAYDGSYDIPNRSGDAKYIDTHEVYVNNVGQRSGHIWQNIFPEPVQDIYPSR